MVYFLLSKGSEQNAADLQKKILAAVGTITDVVSTIGGFANKPPLLQQSVEELRQVYFIVGLAPYNQKNWRFIDLPSQPPSYNLPSSQCHRILYAYIILPNFNLLAKAIWTQLHFQLYDRSIHMAMFNNSDTMH